MAGTLAAQQTGVYPIRIFLPLVVPFAILAAVGVFAFTSHPRTSGATVAPGTRGSLVWGDGLFAKPVEMKAWLRLHGGRYGSWAKQHPAGLNLITPQVFRPPTAAAQRAAKIAARKHAAAKKSAAQAP
jgi:hypothetical protein